jgi:hypothetical protein
VENSLSKRLWICRKTTREWMSCTRRLGDKRLGVWSL